MEARLGTALPPSHRTFLLLSDGTRTIWLPNCPPYEDVPSWVGFFPCAHVDWFSSYQPEWIQIWCDIASEGGRSLLDSGMTDVAYFDYSRHQDCASLKVGHMQTALQVSATHAGEVFLLNPQVISPDGEWELWYLGNHLPGAYRFASFGHVFDPEARALISSVDMPV